jgi:hypothetical protein
MMPGLSIVDSRKRAWLPGSVAAEVRRARGFPLAAPERIETVLQQAKQVAAGA